MNDDDQIRELLDSAAPDQPDVMPGARAGAVRTRARAVRRRNGLLLAAAAVVAVAAVGTGVAVVSSGGDPAPGGGLAADPTPTAVPVVECPTPPTDVSEGLGVKDLPEGATSARVCPATFASQQGTVEFTLPTTPITVRADVLVDALRNLPAGQLGDDCALISVAPMPWSLVIGYPDGSTRELGTTTTICSTVDIAGTPVLVDDVLGLVQSEALLEESGSDPADVAGDLCPEPGPDGAVAAAPNTYPGKLADLGTTSIAVCYGVDPNGAAEYADTQGSLVGDALDGVLEDLLQNASATRQVAGRCTDTGPTRLLVLAGDQGQVTLTDDSCTSEFAFDGGFWLAGPESENAIAAALGGRTGG